MNELIKTLEKAKKELNREYNIILKISIKEIENIIKKENMNEIQLKECTEFLEEVLYINSFENYKNTLIDGAEYVINDIEDVNKEYIIYKTSNTVYVKMFKGKKKLIVKLSNFTLGFQFYLLKTVNEKYKIK